MPQGEFRITGPGVYRTRDGRRAFVTKETEGEFEFWIEGDPNSSPSDPWFCKPNGRGWFGENPRDLIAYIGLLPDARPAPEAVDWQRVRIDAAIQMQAVLLRQSLSEGCVPHGKDVASDAITYADALLAELKRTGDQP